MNNLSERELEVLIKSVKFLLRLDVEQPHILESFNNSFTRVPSQKYLARLQRKLLSMKINYGSTN